VGSEPNFVLARFAAERATVLNWDPTPVDFFWRAERKLANQ
jgi:hypothetical protein